jgi:hypothetical protein
VVWPVRRAIAALRALSEGFGKQNFAIVAGAT